MLLGDESADVAVPTSRIGIAAKDTTAMPATAPAIGKAL
jgi:hypothetical protein